MKLIILLLISTFVVGSLQTWHPKSYFCKPNKPLFSQRHAWFLSTIADGRDEGFVWANDVQVITPDENLNYVNQLARFTYFQDNYYDKQGCSFNSLQAWPRLLQDGTVAWAVQEIAAEIEIPYVTLFDTDDDDQYEDTGVDNESPSVYDVKWLTPKLVESLAIVEGTVRTEVALSDAVGCIAWKRPETDTTVLFECLMTADPGKRRLYSLNVPVELVPGDKSTTILGAWNTFLSVAIPAPEDIAEAFARYRAGTLPQLPDPNAGPYGPLVYLYVPDASKKRDISEVKASTMNENFNGMTFPRVETLRE